MVQFAGHAHVHDEYSLLDGSANRNQLSHQAVIHGQEYLGITNHGRLAGVLEHVDACRHPENYDNPLDESQKRSSDERLIPTMGLEAFYRPDRFMDLSDPLKYGKNGHNWAYHLCLHAANLTGWQTLLRLSAKSWVKREFGGGFYGKPCIDDEMLDNDHEGIIISTACISSPVSQLILAGDESGAKRWLKKARRWGPVFLEIMPHDLDMQRKVNIGKVNLGYDMGMPFYVTGDVHTPYQAWKNTQALMRFISFRQTFSDEKQKKDEGEEIYTEEHDTIHLSSGKELLQMFNKNHPDLPTDVVKEGLANTYEFFHTFKPWVFGKRMKMPHVDVDAKAVVWKWVQEGFQAMKDEYPGEHWKKYPYEVYEQRIEDEWEVLVNKDVVDYFYIVGDFVRWAKSDLPLPIRVAARLVFPKGKHKKPIRVGLGRGSAAGCIISRLIGITGIDPIPHELLFERFLNPDREGMPDIDMDFESGEEGRELLKEYLRIVYGRANVADVIAYQTFAPRAVIKAVCDVYEVDFKIVKDATESIGETERGLEKCAAKYDKVAAIKDDMPEIWEHCLRLEDQIKNDSRHASAVIITDKPVTETGMAVQTGSDGRSIITAWSDRVGFPVVSKYGWQKFDILGINSLNKIQLACDLILKHYGERFEPNDLPPLRDPRDVDPKVMEGFCLKRTHDVFQFMGDGITNTLYKMQPKDTIDVAVANALYRPGASEQIDTYIARKNGDEKWELWHPSLEPYLGYTYGIIAFQEQVMQVCKVLGNFTGGQADFMRKAISKLYRLGKEEAQKEMQPFWDIWERGCLKNGIPRDLIREIWTLILNFGGYSFNRSHSASYGLQAYQDMHLKTYFPLAFYAASLTITKKQKKKEKEDFLRSALREARIFGIEALPPDVNKSAPGWEIEDGSLRFGLDSVNDMGWAAAKAIMDNRPYTSFNDYMKRAPENVDIGHAKVLAKAGAFDAIEDREYLLGLVQARRENAVPYLIDMSCGCTRNRTVKITEKQMDALVKRFDRDVHAHADGIGLEEYIAAELEEKTRQQLSGATCAKHPEGTAVDWEEKDDRILVVEWIKDNPGEKPKKWQEPTANEIAEMERDALNVSMSNGSVVIRYHDFIADRVMSEARVEEIPRQPKRKKVNGKMMHGSSCGCKECKASQVVIGGEIIRYKVIKTKGGDPMAFATMVFDTSSYEITFFPGAYRDYHRMLSKPTAFFVRGNLNDRGSISVDVMMDVTEVAEESGWEPPALKRPEKTKKPKLTLIRGGGEKTTKPMKIKAVASAR